MKKINDRLLEERKRLGFNKGQMALAGGVRNSTYTNYEEGLRSPDANFLAAISESGADVQYILTGIRASESALPKAAQADQPLTVRQQAILGLFDALSPNQQQEILQAAEEKKRLEELEKMVIQLTKKLG